jgi:hypothetical protein
MAPSKTTFVVLFFGMAILLAGCGAVLINEGSKEESLSDGLKNPAKLAPKVVVPPDQALISDFEDGSVHMNPKLYGAKAGMWTATTYSGTVNTPLVVPGGANGTAMALHVSGTLINKGDNTYPSFVLSGKFKSRGFFDASPFQGIRFYYKCPADDQATSHRFSVPIAATVPTSNGGTCTDGCFNHFGTDLPAAADWIKKDLAFADLKRGSGWGSPVAPPDFTDHLKEIIDVEWVDGSGNNAGSYKIDYWVDEVEFY